MEIDRVEGYRGIRGQHLGRGRSRELEFADPLREDSESLDDWSKLARTKIRVCGAYRNVVDGIVVTEYTVFKSSMKE